MKVLVTGGAGYIGSTTATALEQAGHEPVLLDSLVTGPRAFTRGRTFYEGDVADRDLLRRVFDDHPDIAATVHMAARVVVPESVARPDLYYSDNVAKSIVLLQELAGHGCTRVVFSSSASVYAVPTDGFEVDEDAPLAPSSPYARTKLMVETVLEDLCAASALRGISLRYFNPVGSDPGLFSGVHAREPSHVLGQLLRAAAGQQAAFTLTGTDYATRDGSGLRDYVHVWDLARAHVAAVEGFDRALATTGTTSTVLNLGTGDAVTVRELVASFERVSGTRVPLVEAPRRPGDVPGAYAAVARAERLLGWRAELGIDEAIDSALAWWRRRDEVLGHP